MKRICCYSISITDGDGHGLLIQLLTSVESLRAFNRDVLIVIFIYGEAPIPVKETLKLYNVRIWQLPSYSLRISQVCPNGALYLSQSPLFHRFLNFAEISSLHPTQVMLLDCDTYFQEDVAHLFEKYNTPDVVAREEVRSRRSYYEYDTAMIDEDKLRDIGLLAGIQPALPFNCGIILLNNHVWRKLAGLNSLYLTYAWRFMIWMAENASEASSQFGEGIAIEELRQNAHMLLPGERFLALPYPSANRWIMDEIALWMTLGHLPDLMISDFAKSDVIQNGEFVQNGTDGHWVACHYFSQNSDLIARWLHDQASAHRVLVH